MPLDKSYKLLTDHMITGLQLKSRPAQEKWFVKPSIHVYISLIDLVGWLYKKQLLDVMTCLASNKEQN